MTIHPRLRTWAIVVATALATAAHAQLPAYRATQLLPPDAAFPYNHDGFFSLTDAGEVVGRASFGKDYIHRPVRWDAAGRPHDMGADVGQLQAGIAGANDHGTFVGQAWEPLPDGDYARVGLVWQNGTLIRSRDQTGADFLPESVNNLGWQGGAVMSGEFDRQAAYWDGRSLHLLPGLGTSSHVSLVHDSGLMAGSAFVMKEGFGVVSRAVVWRDGQLIDLGRDDDLTSSVIGIDDAGKVLVSHHDERYDISYEIWDGQAYTPVDLGPRADGSFALLAGMTDDGAYWGFEQGHGRQDAMIWKDGIAHNLNDRLDAGLKAQGYWLEAVIDINDAGQILARGRRMDQVTPEWTSFHYAGFVLTPVPEPSTWLMSAVGLGLMGWRLRTQRRRPAAH